MPNNNISSETPHLFNHSRKGCMFMKLIGDIKVKLNKQTSDLSTLEALLESVKQHPSLIRKHKQSVLVARLATRINFLKAQMELQC